MKSFKPDSDEQKLIDSIDRNEWKSVMNLDEEIHKARKIARQTMAKDEKITIRISGRDLELLKTMAMDEGLPYQTMVTSVLHKYVTGKLKE
jgi:predicted DNA binding CopG/RHH family protein